jgi:hypothetical protein
MTQNYRYCTTRPLGSTVSGLNATATCDKTKFAMAARKNKNDQDILSCRRNISHTFMRNHAQTNTRRQGLSQTF